MNESRTRLNELMRQRDNAKALLTHLDAEIADERIRAAARAGDVARTLLVAVCDLYEVHPSEVISDSRDSGVIKARRSASWVLREYGLSYPVAGRILELDHTTVMHHHRTVQRHAPTRLLLLRLLQEHAPRPATQVS